MTTARCSVILLLGAGVIAAARVTPTLLAQSSPTTQRQSTSTPDTNSALLAEVRALRAEIAEASHASLRSQLLVARVQLQEQRIIYLDRRRSEMSAKVSDAAERTRETSARSIQMDEQLQSLRTNTEWAQSLGQAERTQMQRDLVAMAADAKREAQAAQEAEQRLRAEEAELAGALATEQGRWSEFNTRLDELERALPR